MAAVNTVDQVAVLAGALLNTVSFALPEKRPPDVLTLAHHRAAKRVHEVAQWMLRGSDLTALMRRTPFTAEGPDELWQYYETLPLDRTPHLFAVFLAGVEVLEFGGVMTRKDFPKLRRLIDLYSVALGTACMIPRRFFYQLHRAWFSYEMSVARQQAVEPQAPLLFSSEVKAALSRTLDSTGLLREGAGGGAVTANSPDARARLPLLLLASSLGVGVAVLWQVYGPLYEQRARDAIRDAALYWWAELLRYSNVGTEVPRQDHEQQRDQLELASPHGFVEIELPTQPRRLVDR